MIYYGGVLLLVWVIAIAQLAVWAHGWRELRTDGDALLVQWPFRSLEIPVADVEDLALRGDQQATRLDADVIVRLKDDTVLRFGGVRGGGIALYAHLTKMRSRHAERRP